MRAFTLIELLVVIAIIAILAAILFPVFAQAKKATKTAASLANNKQAAVPAKKRTATSPVNVNKQATPRWLKVTALAKKAKKGVVSMARKVVADKGCQYLWNTVKHGGIMIGLVAVIVWSDRMILAIALSGRA